MALFQRKKIEPEQQPEQQANVVPLNTQTKGDSMAKPETKDIGTILKKGGTGPGTYWTVNYDKMDDTSYLTTRELNEIIKKFQKSKLKDDAIEASLLNQFVVWSEKTTFMRNLEEAGIKNSEAYNFMLGKKTVAGPAKKDDKSKLVSILIGLKPNMGAKELMELLKTMIKNYETEAVEEVERMARENGYNVNAKDGAKWISALSPAEKAAKAKREEEAKAMKTTRVPTEEVDE